MGYLPISIREAMDKILKQDWVLPVTQRPYVWGKESLTTGVPRPAQ